MTDHEEIPTPIGPVYMPPMEQFLPILCKQCGAEIGGTLEGYESMTDTIVPKCPYCGGKGGIVGRRG